VNIQVQIVSSKDNDNTATASVDQTTSPTPVMRLPFCCTMPLRYLSLFSLVFQNCAAVLLIRYTQQVQNVPGSAPEKKYDTSSLVAVTEAVKFLVCLMVVAGPHGSGIGLLKESVLSVDCLKMAIPAALYTLQNTLLFTALANLEATMFQVLYQLKVLTTALMMVLVLNVRLTLLRWIALIILFIGVVFTQFQGTKVSRASMSPQNLLTGLSAVITCALSSSFASVYFEKILKHGSASSLWIRNIQLAIFSFMFAIGSFGYNAHYTDDGSTQGFFTGYTTLTCVLIGVQALGGILVALVMKYADNILKGFATSVAIIVSGIFSYMFLDFTPTVYFMIGAMTVILAVMLYSLPDAPAPPKESSAV